MQTRQISINIYEAGDVLDITKITGQYRSKQARIDSAKKALVLSRRELLTGEFSYCVITDEAKSAILRPAELGEEKYIGHINLSLLFGEERDAQ